MWVPTTSVKVLVPEIATLPRLTIGRSAYMSLGDPKLGPSGPGLRIRCDADVHPQVQQYLDAQLGPALAGLSQYVRLRTSCGAIGLTVNGYVADPARLDHLVAVVGHAAAVFVEVGRPTWQPAPFLAGLGPYDQPAHPPGYPSFVTTTEGPIAAALSHHATHLGWTVEDPVALHRRFPTLPVPGVSCGVIAGVVPGSGAPARLSWHTQQRPGSPSALRGAGVFVARADAAATRPGGELVAATDMYVAVVDGLACTWARLNTIGELRASEVLQRSVETVRACGLVDA